MSGTVLDVLLVLMLVLYAVTGYRQGILVSTLSLVGFLGGGMLGMWLLPSILANVEWVTSNEVIRVLVLVFLVFLCATVGQAMAVPLGNRLRAQVRGRSGQALDAIFGAVATVIAVSLLVWFVAGAVRGAAPTPLAKAIGESRILATIDGVVPPAAGQLFAGFRSLLDQNGIPKVFGGLSPEPIAPVAPPESGVAASPGIQQASQSVVRVTGVAVACRRGQEGSGWVVAPGKVVTNAHVVAGMREAAVQVAGVGREYPAQIVVFDPERDLAVLAVEGLTAAPLGLGGSLAAEDESVVAGFPLDGPYRLDPARVRRTLTATGSDIYGQPGVTREIYSLFARVEPGNSGGPLLSPTGEVVGVVFAKSLDDPSTGYALTLAEAQPVLRAAAKPASRSRPAVLHRLTPGAGWRSGGFRRSGRDSQTCPTCGLGTGRVASVDGVEPVDDRGADPVGGLLGEEVAGAVDQLERVRPRHVLRGTGRAVGQHAPVLGALEVEDRPGDRPADPPVEQGTVLAQLGAAEPAVVLRRGVGHEGQRHGVAVPLHVLRARVVAERGRPRPQDLPDVGVVLGHLPLGDERALQLNEVPARLALPAVAHRRPPHHPGCGIESDPSARTTSGWSDGMDHAMTPPRP